MRLKTVVILVLTPLVAGFIHFANAGSRTALAESIAQDKTAQEKADAPKSRKAAKETKESPPWNDFLQAAADGNDTALMRLLKEGAKPDDKSANGWTPLMWAAEAGHLKTVKILLEHGADVNAVGNNCRSALMLAAYRSQHEVVSTLLGNGASPNVPDPNGMTALMFACLAGDEKTATALATKGADVNAVDKAGFTPLMKVTNARIVDLLVKHGADVNAKSNDGRTALMTAAREKYTSVIKALLKSGADIRLKDRKGSTAVGWGYKIDQGGGFMEVHEVLEIFSRDNSACLLCQACILGRTGLVKRLLGKGADPNLPCDLGEYKAFPLLEATGEGHAGIVKLLLDKGAQILDRKGYVDALYMAARKGHVPTVKLLIERGALPKADRYWGSACEKCNPEIIKLLVPYMSLCSTECLEWAARGGCSENVKILLDSGVGVGPEIIYVAATKGNSRTLELLLARAKDKGMSPHEFGRSLHGAASDNRSKSVAVLLKYGADVNHKDPEYKDRTPLMAACFNNATEAARMLIKKGADVNAKDRNGAYAMSWSYTEGRAHLVKLLKAHGAKDDSPKRGKEGIKTLYEAVAARDVKAARELLTEGLAEGTEDDQLSSSLESACANGNLEMVKLLLEFKANPNYGTNVAGKALHAAAEKASGSIVKLLIDHGADIEAGIAGGEDTPLLVAVEHGNLEAAQVLLEHGANIKAYVEPQGDSIGTPTALDLVSRNKNDKMRQLLLRFGVEYSELMDPKDFQRGGDE